MELKTYLEIIIRRKWIVVFTTLATLLIVFAGSLLITPVYRATTTFRVARATIGSVEYTDIRTLDTLMNTYAAIAVSQPVLAELAQTLGISGISKNSIEVEIIPGTELLSITAEATTPNQAQDIANNLAQIMIDQSRRLYMGGADSAQQILVDQLAIAEDELRQAQSEYEVMLAQGVTDESQLRPISGKIDFKERTYGLLLDRYEQARLTEAIRSNAITVVEPASLPTRPAEPRLLAYLLLAALVGGTGGVALVLVLDNVDSTIYSRRDVESLTDWPFLVEIPDGSTGPRLPFLRASADLNGSLVMDEAFRSLRLRLIGPPGSSPPRTILVASGEPGEGKSTVLAKLAAMYAEAGSSVAVVDSDLRLPRQHEIWELPNATGLSSILRGSATLDQAIQKTPVAEVRVVAVDPATSAKLEQLSSVDMESIRERLEVDIDVPEVHVISSGARPSNPAELLSSAKMKALLSELSARFDVVLLDSPSLLAVADGSVLAQLVDSVILIVGLGKTQKGAFVSGAQKLEDVNAIISGIVLNRGKLKTEYYSYLQEHGLTPPRTVVESTAAIVLPIDAHGAREELPTDRDKTPVGIRALEGPRERAESHHSDTMASLGLASRVVSALDKEGLVTIEDVLPWFEEGAEETLLAIKGFGPKALADLTMALKSSGLISDDDKVTSEATEIGEP